MPAISIDVRTYALNQKEYNKILLLVEVGFIIGIVLSIANNI